MLGSGWYGTPAVDVKNAQGDHVVDLMVTGYRVYAGKKPLAGLPLPMWRTTTRHRRWRSTWRTQ